MTNQQDTALLPVAQIDREAALRAYPLAHQIEDCAFDERALVQAFARHRIAAEQAKPSASCEAGEVERVARAIDPIEWKTIDHWWPYRGTANYDDRVDNMRARSLGRATAAITALRANAPEGQGEVERAQKITAKILGYTDWSDATDYRLSGAQDRERDRVFAIIRAVLRLDAGGKP